MLLRERRCGIKQYPVHTFDFEGLSACGFDEPYQNAVANAAIAEERSLRVVLHHILAHSARCTLVSSLVTTQYLPVLLMTKHQSFIYVTYWPSLTD